MRQVRICVQYGGAPLLQRSPQVRDVTAKVQDDDSVGSGLQRSPQVRDETFCGVPRRGFDFCFNVARRCGMRLPPNNIQFWRQNSDSQREPLPVE